MKRLFFQLYLLQLVFVLQIALGKTLARRIFLGYLRDSRIHLTLNLGHRVILIFKAPTTSNKVHHQQIHSVLVIVTRLTSDSCHQHHLFYLQIIIKARNLLWIFRKSVAQQQGNGLCLPSNCIKFELNTLSQFLYLCTHMFQFNSLLHLLLWKEVVFIGFLYS